MAGLGLAAPPGILGVAARDGGFHIKAALLDLSRPYFAAKLNGNFRGNRERFGLPTIQGVIALFDGENGRPLALMDSIEITLLRTAAATAVAAGFSPAPIRESPSCAGAARRAESSCGRSPACFRSSRSTPATRTRRPPRDSHGSSRPGSASRLRPWPSPDRLFGGATFASPARPPGVPSSETRTSRRDCSSPPWAQTLPTNRSSIRRFCGGLASSWIRASSAPRSGMAPRPRGRERILPEATELAEVVAGAKPGRLSPEEVTVFDSTGIALEDVAAAAAVYERAVATGRGRAWSVSDSDPR